MPDSVREIPAPSLNLEATRRQLLLGAVAAGLVQAVPAFAAPADAPLRVALSLPDLPRLWAGPDGGFEGIRFGGYPLFDALINWDLSRSDRPATLQPGLAQSWSVDPADKTRWIVTLRRDATFHDGSPWNADAAVWNFASVLDSKAPQYSAPRSAAIRSRISSVIGAEKRDEFTLVLKTDVPDAMVPYQLTFLFFASPTQYAKLGGDWNRFATEPSGTGPFKFVSLVPRSRLELARNDAYWDKERVAKSPGLVLLPIPDPNTRVSALRSGQVDIIESVPPDVITSLKQAGFQVLTGAYPHVWIWYFSVLPDSPFSDLRVRKAANLAIDRDGLVSLLAGTATPATGFVDAGSPWYGTPSFKIKYDPAAAKALLAEAGYGPEKRIKTKILISNSGGGQMQPLPMNEFIQGNLAEVGIDVEFQVVDFITLFTDYREGAKKQPGVTALNLSLPTQDPTAGFLKCFASDRTAPRGTNWGYYSSPDLDAALHEAQEAFEPGALDRAMAKVNTLMVDAVPALLAVHDLNPRALSPGVKGFVQAQNWFADFTSVRVAG